MIDKIKCRSCISEYKILTTLLLILIIWILLLIKNVPDRWEDSYNYILAATSSVQEGYDNFSFGKKEHPLYAFLLYLFTKVIGYPYVAAKGLSALCYVISIIYLFMITKKIGELKTSIVSITLCTVIFIDYAAASTAVLSGPLFAAVLLAIFYYQLENKTYLASILIGLLSFIRSEFIIILISFLLIYIIQKKLKQAIIIFLVNLPFVAAWYFFVISKVPSAKSEIIDRFGERTIIQVIETTFQKLSIILFGGLSFGVAISIVVILMAAIIFVLNVKKVYFRYNNDFLHNPFVFTLLFVLSNLTALTILNYQGRHPLAIRHLSYLVPFISIMMSQIIIYVDSSIASIYPRAKSKQGLVIVFILFLMILSMPGRFYYLSHYMDGNIETGKWLAKRIKKQENFISPLPSVIFYSGMDFSRAYLGYPHRITDLNEYKKRNIEYVAWSNIYAGHNLMALEKLMPLKDGQDYLFFKHVYSPSIVNGWYAKIYSIEESLNTTIASSLGSGWYGKEPWGRWAKGPVSTVIIYSQNPQQVTISFSVGSFIEPAEMQIYIGEKLLKNIHVEPKKGNDTTPTDVSLSFNINEGENILKLVGPEKTFIPSEVGAWEDNRNLRLGFSNVLVNNQKLF